MAMVSIVVAAWRPDPAQFEAALRSALVQTWDALEVMVADDSPGGEARVVVEALDDPRLRYVRRDPPLGVAQNHWAAFAEARGEYLSVLNHDDLLEPGFVNRLVGALEREPAAVLAFCDHWIVDAAGERLSEQTHRNTAQWGRAALAAGLHKPAQNLVMRQSIPIAMGSVFRRTALPSRLPQLAGPAYDFWLSHLLCRRGGGVWYEPERLSSWRTHANSLTHAAGPDWLEGAARCWADIAADPAYSSFRAEARRHAASAFRSASTAALRHGQTARARRLAATSLAWGSGWKGLAAGAMGLLPVSVAQRLLGVRA